MQIWLNAFLTRSDLTSSLDGHICQWPVMVFDTFLLATQLGQGQRRENEKGGKMGEAGWCDWIWPEYQDEIWSEVLSYCVQSKKDVYDVYPLHENMIQEASSKGKGLWQNWGSTTSDIVTQNQYRTNTGDSAICGNERCFKVEIELPTRQMGRFPM